MLQHYFLQKLPYLPHLRSLYLPFIPCKESSNIGVQDEKELALQVIDIITLRPEIELCYLAIAEKCFEVLESRGSARDARGTDHNLDVDAESDESDDDDDDEDDEDDEEDDDADDATATVNVNTAVANHEDSETDEEDYDSADEGSELGDDAAKCQLKFKLREILFYDDQVAIFKARHGTI